MSDVLDKLTFRFLVGQLLPGAVLVLTGHMAFRLAADDRIENPRALIDRYTAAAKGIDSIPSVLLFFALAVVAGMILHGLMRAAAANMESFRSHELSAANRWVRRPDDRFRRRSDLRSRLARGWFEYPLGWLFLLGPVYLVFDLVTIAAARPRHVYKEIYLLMTDQSRPDLLNYALSDYQYLSDYFANMSVAMLLWAVGITVAAATHGSAGVLAAVLPVGYALASLHYLLYRVVKTSIDQAVFRTFAEPEEPARSVVDDDAEEPGRTQAEA